MAQRLINKIGIVGNGMVGSTLNKWFKNALVYDVNPKKSKNSLDDLNKKTELIFIAVPTPFKKKFDLSLVLEAIGKISGNKIIVIKSTVLPGTTEELQKKFPQHSFLFNPEFLTEKTAYNDFLNPDMQLLGVTNRSKKLANKILKLLPKGKINKILTANEAEAIKYFRNCFYATKVVFANQFYDFCKQQLIDYENIKNVIKHDKMISPYHLDVFHQGGRGAGGKCLAKDLAAFTSLSQLPLFKKTNALNRSYLKKTPK